MTDAIVYIDRSEIRPGKVEEVRRRIIDVVEFVQANEPQLIVYAFSIDEMAPSMTVVAVHPDSASLDLHIRIGSPAFRTLADLIDLQSIDVYGAVTATVLNQLHAKARMLGQSGTVIVHPHSAGFARI